MSAMMRCDSCNALRWYGAQLEPVKVLEYPGPIERTYFICAVCAEDRKIALWPEDWGPYQPTMHPPHYSRQ